MSFFNELKRRNVFKVAIAYVAVVWLVAQVLQLVFDSFGTPDWVMKTVLTLMAVGFVFALFFAWAFEMTPEGIRRENEVDRSDSTHTETGKKLNNLIIAVMALALAYFAYDKYILSGSRDAELAKTTEEAPITETTEESAGGDVTSVAADRSIAVLPFVNMSPDPDQAFFADGISEELLNLLAKIPDLRVTSRSSSFLFRGDGLDLHEVAAKLNVAHVLEGSVRKAGNQVRITVQLIDARSDTHLWSETYDRPLDDIFAIQDEVAEQVVEQLHLTLMGQTPRAQPVNLDAFALALEARQIVALLRRDQLGRAEELLKEALRIEPGYLEALEELQQVYWVQRQAAWPERQDEYTELIEEVRSRTLKLDPDNADILSSMAWDMRTRENNVAEAAALLERASQIEPSNEWVLIGSGRLALEIGRLDLAIPIMEYLVQRDPMRLWNYDNLARAYLFMGRYEEAIQQYNLFANLQEKPGSTDWETGMVMLMMSDPSRALSIFEQSSDEFDREWGMSMALYDLGRVDESAEALERLREMDTESLAQYRKYFGENIATAAPMKFALAYAWTGKADEAFDYLRQEAERTRGIRANAVNGPMFQRIRNDPRWLPFLREFGLSPEQLAEIEFNPRLPEDLPFGR